jgi:hypothetical protein
MNITEFYTAVINELVHYPEAKLTDILPIMESICPDFSFDTTIEVYTDEREIGYAANAYFNN